MIIIDIEYISLFRLFIKKRNSKMSCFWIFICIIISNVKCTRKKRKSDDIPPVTPVVSKLQIDNSIGIELSKQFDKAVGDDALPLRMNNVIKQYHERNVYNKNCIYFAIIFPFFFLMLDVADSIRNYDKLHSKIES